MTTSYKTDLPRVLIVILNHNQKTDTLNCIASVKKLDYSNYGILLVDNNSTDASADKVREQYPDIHILRMERNIGAVAGRNTGIDYALNSHWDYIFFLDNDAIVESSTLTELMKVAKSSTDIAAVGAKTYYYDTPQKIWNFGGRINWCKGSFFDTNQKEYDKGQLNLVKEVDTFPVGFGIVKSDVIRKAGKINEKYFIYYEETDWHVKMKKHGYKLLVTPRAKIWHKASSSLGMESPDFYYYRSRNRLLFMWRNAPKLCLPIFFFYWVYDFSYNTLLTLYLSNKPQQLCASMVGILDFLRGNFGKRIFTDNDGKGGIRH